MADPEKKPDEKASAPAGPPTVEKSPPPDDRAARKEPAALPADALAAQSVRVTALEERVFKGKATQLGVGAILLVVSLGVVIVGLVVGAIILISRRRREEHEEHANV